MMDQSNKESAIDDFTSLFLPDLLNPLSGARPTDNKDHGKIKSEQQVNVYLDNMTEEMDDYNQNPAVSNRSYNNHLISHYGNLIPLEAGRVQQNFQQAPMYHMNFQYPPYGVQYFDAHNFIGQTDQYSMDPLQMPPNLQNQDRYAAADFIRLGSVTMPNDHRNIVYPSSGDEVIPARSTIELSRKQPASKSGKRKDRKSVDSQIDYDSKKLTRLLDFKPGAEFKDTLLDNDDNIIKIDFMAFLKGKFVTNDSENRHYLVTQNSQGNKEVQKDPKVVSCYRRNYIQVPIKMSLSGFKSSDKILKLQTVEFGYLVKRVVKWFQIEVSASSNMTDSVPFDVKKLPNDRGLKAEIMDGASKPRWIQSKQHILTLNDTEIIDGEISHLFIIKKLQFRNATPHNGSSTFQSYYRLKMKLSAIVADLYCDDYIEDENRFSNNQNTNEVVLCELMSEPIVVRGRTPNFYNDRMDFPIKNRPIYLKNSFMEDDSDMQRQEEVEVQDLNALDNTSQNDGSEKEKNENAKQVDLEWNDEAIVASSEDEHERDEEEETDENSRKSHSGSRQSKTAIDFKSLKKYNYFPISSVYYLPPVNVVYFPHGTHQHSQNDPNQNKQTMDVSQTLERKGSKVYFK